MANLAKLEADLQQLEKTAKLPTIANNKALSESMAKKIAKLKEEIKEAKGSKISAPTAKETAKAAPKKEVKKEKAPKKAKAERSAPRVTGITSKGGFKVGEKVTWVKRATGEKMRGEIVKIYESNNRPGKFIAVVKDKQGAKHEPTIDYLSHA